MLLLPESLRKELSDWTLENVPDFHLGTGGREFTGHVTLAYGFVDEDSLADDLRSLLQRWGPMRLRLAPTLSLFADGKNEDGDVLKIAVESEQLHEMHRVILDLFDCPGDKFPDYKPHITLAYINDSLGVAKTYAAMCAPFLGRSVEIEEAEYSAADGTKTRFRLGFLPALGRKMLGVKPHAVNKVLAWDDAMTDGGGHGQFVCGCGRVIRQCRCRATADNPQRVYHVTDRLCRECEKGKNRVETFPHEKAMSWQGSGSGGDLVAPPEFRGVLPRKRRPSLLADKSIDVPHIKSRGMPCKQGEAASRTGCIPAKEDLPKTRPAPETPPEQLENLPPTDVRTRPAAAPDRPRATNDRPKTVALQSDSAHKKLLRTLPIKERRPLDGGGINEGKELLTLSDGSKAVYKPSLGEPEARPSIPAGTFYLREAAASALADILGFGDLVPATVVRDGGSVQRFIGGAMLAIETPPNEDFGSDPNDAARAAVFDYIMGAGDRHHGNWLVKNGKLVLIDNGLTLPTSRDINDYADVEFFHHAAEASLPMPDVSDLQGKWPAAEKALSELNIEPKAIALAKERYDYVVSGRYHKVADLPSPVNPTSGRTLGQFARKVEILAISLEDLNRRKENRRNEGVV
jgi:2'-5' RNA ligase